MNIHASLKAREAIEEENELLNSQYNEAVEKSKEIKSKILKAENKRQVLQKLCDTFTSDGARLQERLSQLDRSSRSARFEDKKVHQKKIQEIQDQIDNLQAPLRDEKLDYEMVMERMKYVKDAWEKKIYTVEKKLIEQRIKEDLLIKKMEIMDERFEKYQSYFIDSGITTHDFEDQMIFKRDMADQYDLEHELEVAQQKKENIVNECRSLQEQKESLKEQMDVLMQKRLQQHWAQHG